MDKFTKLCVKLKLRQEYLKGYCDCPTENDTFKQQIALETIDQILKDAEAIDNEA